jgi:hypothetical protein
MNKAVLKLNLDMRDRLRKRVEFSKSYEELNSKAGSVSAVLYSIFKSALYDYKFTDERGRETDEAVNDFLDLRGIPYHKDSSTKLKSRKYLDYASSEELDVLNEGIRRIRELVVLSNKDFAGFPNVFEDVAKLGRELRGKFYRDTDIQIESYPMQEETIGRIKNAEIKFQKENNTFRVKPKNQKKQTLQNQSIDNTLTNDAINSANKDDKIKTPTKKPALKLNQDMKDRLRNRVEFSLWLTKN